MSYYTRHSNKLKAHLLIFDAMPHETNRTQWFHRQLSKHLAKIGVSSLRFDYSGTGNSSSYFEDISLSDWREDMLCLGDHYLNKFHEQQPIFALGTRIGAHLAKDFIDSRSNNPNSFVITVDAIESGSQLIADLASLQDDFVNRRPYHAPFPPQNASSQIFGYPWNEKFRQELSQLQADFHKCYNIRTQSKRRSISCESEVYSQDNFDWLNPETLGLLAFPNQTVSLITNFVKERCL